MSQPIDPPTLAAVIRGVLQEPWFAAMLYGVLKQAISDADWTGVLNVDPGPLPDPAPAPEPDSMQHRTI